MKVVITIDTLARGGTETSLLTMIPRFSRETEAVVVYFYNDHSLKPQYEAAGIRTIYLNIRQKYGFAEAIGKLRRVLKEESAQLVVSHLYRANIISRIACKLDGIPLVGTFVDDSYGEQRRSSFRGFSKIKFWCTWLADRLTAGIPEAYIANGEHVGSSNRRALGVDSDKIVVIHRGRDTKLIGPWQPPEHVPFLFGAVGRLHEKKGFGDLLRAFARLRKDMPDVRLLIIGEGAYRPVLQTMINDAGISELVDMPGSKDQPWKYLGSCHAFVFPSWYEGFSGVLIEAMITGIPIIASDISMNLEAIDHGVTARVCKVRDIESLYHEMKWVVTHYKKALKLGARARSIALDKYDIAVVAADFEKILFRITKGSRHEVQ